MLTSKFLIHFQIYMGIKTQKWKKFWTEKPGTQRKSGEHIIIVNVEKEKIEFPQRNIKNSLFLR